AAMARSGPASMLAISIAAAGVWGTFGPFWAIPPESLSGAAAAAGIALVNSVGNLGGFAGPYLVGLIKQRTGSFENGLLLLSFSLMVAAILALSLRSSARPETSHG